MKYKVKVSYTVWDVYEVEADNEQEAIEIAEERAGNDSLNDFNNDGAESTVIGTCTEDEDEEDPTLTEAEKRDTLCRLWDAAWQQAKADPEGTRVIVETNEEDPSANCNPFGRYYMVDGSESESCIEHAGQWVVIRVDTVTSPYDVHRPNFAAAHGYSDNQTQLACRCENPNNVTRWARLMIDAGRVTDIYADCY